ncbi:hypothetical protein FBULB1_7847 [Fusarium bulbicola]|nr:hypothetical protein FBULB1_7847 [Fusarium bulbicola]
MSETNTTESVRVASSQPYPPDSYHSRCIPCWIHAIKRPYNNPETPFRRRLVEALGDIEWVTIDKHRIGYAESEEALEDRWLCPVTICVFVRPGSTTPEQGQAAVLRCKQVFDEFDRPDMEVDISEDVPWEPLVVG